MDQLVAVRANPSNTGGLGSFGEAVAEVLMHEMLGQHVLADEASRDKPQGMDLLTYDSENDRIAVVEVKTTGMEHVRGPHMSSTKSGPQMSDSWIADSAASPSGQSRIAESGLTNVRLDDLTPGSAVSKMVVHVNTATGTVSLHEFDESGHVDRTATVTVDLEDLVRFSDALRDKS
jgi:hypothetical protein